MVSYKSSSSVEFEIKKMFLDFAFFEELSKFIVSCEHGIFGSIFVRINIFSVKKLNSKLPFTLQNASI